MLNRVRVIQGDGVDELSIDAILSALDDAGYAAGSVVFGMGGGLLQQVNRDTQRFAMKCSAIRRGDVWHDVCKDPVTDQGKRSKKGRLAAQFPHRWYRTTTLPAAWDDRMLEGEWEDALETVFDTGRLLVDTSFAQVRARAHAGRWRQAAGRPAASLHSRGARDKRAQHGVCVEVSLQDIRRRRRKVDPAFIETVEHAHARFG